jgi:hypothetical protein
MLASLAAFTAAGAACAACAAPAAAQAGADSAAFVIRLGTDTTAIERYVRTADRLVAEAVQRSPSTTRHRLALSLAPDGSVTRAEWTVQPAAAAEPSLHRVITFDGDSATVETTQGGSTRSQRVGAAGAIPVMMPFYSPYELAVRRYVGSGRASLVVPLLGGMSVVEVPVSRVAADTIALTNQFGEPMRAAHDAAGNIVRLQTPAFVSVERTAWLDLDRLVADFAQRDAQGRGLGPLSPRSTYRASIGGASVWVDYSRPAARGRPVWGGLVPWGEVWRMGANEAAHIATDRRLRVGDLTIEPGTYTLFLLPAQDGWSLIVNRGTNMSGLERDEAQDVGRTAMTVETMTSPAEQFTIAVQQGAGTEPARLEVRWADRRGWVPLRTEPGSD